ncbi:OsmC family protein [Alteromonas pelagimontana]|uniref:OsmC family protein n=1 Tax=Alteromonas pelagimontana TaxID=1858656 RepID=A0A6M4MDD2_9ALTE|nr:OsmC family protein [Alteromonas pelagimontana]QJR80146.1 OsmC family protein [Alteromonas pelagimontana]
MSVILHKSETGTYLQTIRIHQHTLFADVAASLGGEDNAPDPHDLYDSSLAACKAITLLMYAKRKDISLTSVDIEITRDNSKEKSGIYRLNVNLQLNGELSVQQRHLLKDIAEKCPIHKLMESVETEIHSSVQ